MGTQDDGFLIILDIDRVFSVDELAVMNKTGHEEEVSLKDMPPPVMDQSTQTVQNQSMA